jgi:hypothetical protein
VTADGRVQEQKKCHQEAHGYPLHASCHRRDRHQVQLEDLKWKRVFEAKSYSSLVPRRALVGQRHWHSLLREQTSSTKPRLRR